jgi:hypothetical protein
MATYFSFVIKQFLEEMKISNFEERIVSVIICQTDIPSNQIIGKSNFVTATTVLLFQYVFTKFDAIIKRHIRGSSF